MMFQNLKVVELASVLAGPLTGSFFAELGARVVKIENQTTDGDVTRKWRIEGEQDDSPISAYYAAANVHKQVLFRNYRNEKDYQDVIERIQEADILIVNFKKGDAELFKLDYESIKAIQPRLIYAEITGFGIDSDRTAFDVVLQAETGYMSINGEKGSKPLKMPLAMIDILAAHQLKQGILCALIQRANTQLGCRVSVSLYDAAVSSLANQATNWLMVNQIPKAIGSEHPNIAPYGDLFKTKDEKWIVLAVGSDKQFKNLLELIQLPNFVNDERFRQNHSRVKYRFELIQILSPIFIRESSLYWEEKMLHLQIPFGIVKTIDEVFQSKDAQDLIIKEEQEGMKTLRVKTSIFKISNE